MKNKLIIIFTVCAPFVAAAQNNINGLLNTILGWINSLIPIAFALALLVFFWGLAKFILEVGNTDEHEKGKQLMIWGVIAFFVMASLGGLILFAQRSLGVTNNASIDRPTFDFN